MVIEIGERFQTTGHDGKEIVRGRVLAIRKSEDEAIILAITSSSNNSVTKGLLYLIKQSAVSPFPEIVKEVRGIPNSDGWVFYFL